MDKEDLSKVLLRAFPVLDPRIESCRCRVCRSDLAYIAPCEYEDAIEFSLIDPLKGLDNEERNTNVQAE